MFMFRESRRLQDVYRRSRTCSRSPCTCSGSPGGCREFMEGLGAVAVRHVHVQGVQEVAGSL